MTPTSTNTIRPCVRCPRGQTFMSDSICSACRNEKPKEKK